MNRIFMNLKKKLNSGAVLTLSWGCIYWYISRISGERLQDHWSSLKHGPQSSVSCPVCGPIKWADKILDSSFVF